LTMPAAELGEREAFVDLYETAPEELGARVERIGGAACFALTAVPRSAMFNRALGLGLERAASRPEVDEIAGFFGELGVEWCAAVAPQAEPAELVPWLGELGFEPGYGWAKFRRGVGEAAASTSELRVERAGEREGRVFADVFIRGYGLPPLMLDWLARLPSRHGWHCFVAYDGEAPAATGAIYVSDGLG
jgi:hypothetical protein